MKHTLWIRWRLFFLQKNLVGCIRSVLPQVAAERGLALVSWQKKRMVGFMIWFLIYSYDF